MSDRGVFAVDRGIFDHPIFADEPFTEREAWQWLIAEAAWKPKRTRIGRGVFNLERGQVVHSTRFMATRWQWSEARVRRFLNRLKSDAMVTVLATREATQLTICNYDKYAFGRRTGDAESDAPTDALPTHSRRKEEELKESKKEEKKDSCAVATATRTKPSGKFEEFWKAYPRRDGSNPKTPASKVFDAAVKQGADPQAIIDGARRCAVADIKKIGTPYIPQAVKWLRDQRWLDYAADSPTPSGLSEEERRKMFEKLRGTNGKQSGEGTHLRGTGDGAHTVESDGASRAPDDPPRHAGMVNVGALFHAPLGLRAGSDETSEVWPEPRIYRA